VEALKGMQAQRFDHCLVHGDDLDGTVKKASSKSIAAGRPPTSVGAI